MNDIGDRQGKRFLRCVKLLQRMMSRFKCGFCKRLAIPAFYILFLPAVSAAQNVPVSLVVATGADSVTCQQGRAMFRDVQAIFAPLGVRLQLRWFRCVHNPRRRRTRLSGFGVDNAHWWWDEDYFIGKEYRGRLAVHYAIIPPVKYQDGWYIVGQSNQPLCFWSYSKRVGMSSAMMVNAEGMPRYRHSVIAIAHEIGHLLGFEHDDTRPISIMHSAPLSEVDKFAGWLSWSENSVQKLIFCRERAK